MKKVLAILLVLCIPCLLLCSCSKTPNVDDTHWILSSMESDGEKIEYKGQTNDATFAEFLNGTYTLKSGNMVIQNSPYFFEGNKMYLAESKENVKEADIYYTVKVNGDVMVMKSSTGVKRTFKKYTPMK